MEVLWVDGGLKMNLGSPFAKMAIEHTMTLVYVHVHMYHRCLFLLLFNVAYVTHTHVYTHICLFPLDCRFRINVTLCPCCPRCTPYANETLQRKRGIGRINIHTCTHYMFMYLHVHLFLKTLPMMDVLGKAGGPRTNRPLWYRLSS